MPNTNTALINSIKNLLDAAVQNNIAGAATLAAALETAIAADTAPAASTPCCRSSAKFNKACTLHKSYCTAGFTNKTLKVFVRSKSDHDEIVIKGANDFRAPICEVVEFRNRLDRSSLKAQLRYGVLKISGRTYKSGVDLSDMDLSSGELPVTMKA